MLPRLAWMIVLASATGPLHAEICDQYGVPKVGLADLLRESGQDFDRLRRANPGHPEAAEREWKERWFLRFRGITPALEELRAQRADGVARFDAMYASLPPDSPFRALLKDYEQKLHSDWEEHSAFHRRIIAMRRAADMPAFGEIPDIGYGGDLFGLTRGGFCSPFMDASDRLPYAWNPPFRMLKPEFHPAFAQRVSRMVSMPELEAPFKFNPETRTLFVGTVREHRSQPGVCMPLGGGGFFYYGPTVQLPRSGMVSASPNEHAWQEMMKKLQMDPMPADLVDRSLREGPQPAVSQRRDPQQRPNTNVTNKK